MAPSEIDWELESRGRVVLESATEMFGDERFAGAWYEHGPVPTLHVFAVDPVQSEITALDTTAKEAGLGLTVIPARYSYVELVEFCERLSDAMPGGDACFGFGPDPRANAIQFTLRRLDEDVLAYIRERIPADAIRIIVKPRAPRAVAI